MHIEFNSPPRYVPEDLDAMLLMQSAGSEDRLLKAFYEGSRVEPPLENEKYLDNKEFHYTSSFQIRPQVEYFDFDQRYMFKPDAENKASHEETDENNDTTPRNIEIANHASQSALQEVAEELQREREKYASLKDDYLKGMFTKVDLCKDAFRELIERIDGTIFSTAPYKNTKLDVPVIKEISDLLALVNHNSILQPLIASDVEEQKVADGKALSLPVAPNGLHQLRDDPCASLPNFGVTLLKSPASIAQLWDEYTKVPSDWPVTDILSFTHQQGILSSASNIELVAKRRTSIRQLEELLGSSWRSDDKNFSRQVNRRKKIWKAIEDGLRDGVPLEECFSILETYVKERNKGLSWYYSGVPFALAAMASSKD